MKTLIILVAVTTCFSIQAQTGSEIYLADLKVTESGITLSNQKNITNRKGYDNQPSFHPNKPLLYYSFNDQDRADIKVYNFKSGKTELLTQTNEREYSPTVTPDKKFISCIIQRDNGAQDLGKYPIKGGNPTVLINNLTVGYHAWLNETKLVLFVLGDPMTLRQYDLKTSKDSVIINKGGRSLHKIPGQEKISFVDKNVEPWTINSFVSNKTEKITETLPNREDMAWTPDGKIIMSDGRQFFFYDTKKKSTWSMFFASELNGITRIAVSADGKKIAFVASE